MKYRCYVEIGGERFEGWCHPGDPDTLIGSIPGSLNPDTPESPEQLERDFEVCANLYGIHLDDGRHVEVTGLTFDLVGETNA